MSQRGLETARDDVSATERLIRMLYLGVGATALIFGALSLDTFLRQVYPTFPLASVGVWIFIVGLPAALGFLSHVAPLRMLRRIAVAEAAGFPVVLGFWLIMRFDPLPEGDDVPWVLMLSGIPTVTIAIFASPWTARIYAVLASIASGIIRAATSAEPQPLLVGLQDALYMLLLSSVLVGLTLTIRSSAARVDSEEHVRRAAEAEQAARAARRAERRIINALVHDSVLSTLLMAGLNRASPIVVGRQARSTLDQLDALGTQAWPTVVSGTDFADRLRQQCEQLAAHVHVHVMILQNDLKSIPAPVMLALLGAAGEALRNSVAAAGVGHPHRVHRRVTLSTDQGTIHLAVTDDGVGFDPATVPDHRLGIAESVVGRMERLAGGSAIITSRPGHGTSVDLFWVRPAVSTEPTTAAVTTATSLAQIPGTASRPLSFSASLGLSVHMARGVVVLFIVVHAVLAAANSDRVTPMPLGIFAFLVLSTAAILVTGDAADPMPLSRTVGVLLLTTVAGGLMYFHIPGGNIGPFAHWHLGAITLLLVVLVARGRTAWAWAGYAMMTVVSVFWALQIGHTVGDGLVLVSRHAGTLLAGTLFAVGLRHSSRNLDDLYRDRSRRETFVAQTGATASERQAQVARLNAMARPSLERLTRTDAVTDRQRDEFLLVEASLRDAIRARCLFVEPIIGSTWAARSRGVQVVLLDDSGDRPPASVVRTAAIIGAELDRLTQGRLTVRVLPPGRPEFATIMVETTVNEATESRLLLIARDGTAREA
ncbi:hypothetical protein E3O06_11200 [Cryobacterium glaciale]|uniref:Histidine kinase/HSP90-like ATPase domain-containing protein n=1 Tax=Cryobacterium glaciale TaxID=1259145 RepID=A0A4R8UUY2_9MICO|nr:ATP-binding protein [Cryobacterium glaciale]TFB71823.1 hypothetical protein E3O06_11200 [Cryobacterium glaciale]